MAYAKQITAIIDNIRPVLAERFDIKTYAAGMLDEAGDDETHFEVRGLHTKTGVPYSFILA